MWIFQNDSFLSVVARRGTDELLVRSRIAGDIQRAIPGAKVFEDKHADYRYRSYVTRDQLKAAVSKSIDGIDYDNFKNGVKNKDRHDAYMGVWHVMASWFGCYGRKGVPSSGDPDVDAFLGVRHGSGRVADADLFGVREH